jgi:carboxypeptidase family protein/TonB-dependent receptor-like protein
MRPLRMSCVGIPGCLLAAVIVFLAVSATAQTDSGTVSGRIVDPTGLSIAGVHVRLIDIDRDTTVATVTNNSGLYTFHAVHPGRYRMEVEAKGFRAVNVTGLTVNTQANLEQNFALAIGSISESITVEAKAEEISPAVSTVIDRQFVENIPLNGRSFQTLIQLTPGVVVTPTSPTDSGQFSVNGQRSSANYFMVDGVSANIGASTNPGSTQNAGGAMPGLSALGGTNNLVSVDALQEFRIQTSTYAPEFGRTPGAQISLETRSGTNQLHGALFEYFRNDVLDASNWFNGTTNPALPKSKERQNDFGGVFGGPILKNRTFFFFSYEQQIVRLPRTVVSKVPSLAVRQDPATPAAILPFLNAYPLPNGTASADDVASQIAPFAASFFDPATLKAVSLRVDHKVSDRLELFGRYNFSPSELLTHGDGVSRAASDVTRISVETETLTLGAVCSPSAITSNDLRFNYSKNRGSGGESVDALGGAVVPPDSLFLPSPFTRATGAGALTILSTGALRVGPNVNELQRQINLVDAFSLQKGRHTIRLGVDYRRLSPNVGLIPYNLATTFLNVASAASLHPFAVGVLAGNPVTILFHNLGAYAQDTWNMTPRFSLTYGLRWDVDFSPSTAQDPDLLALTNVDDPNSLAIAPSGSPVFRTRYNNFAPRVGLTYLLSQAPNRKTLLRGGFGVFYDLATAQTADMFEKNPVFPFGGSSPRCNIFACNGVSLTFPLPAAVVQRPSITFSPTQPLTGFDPELKLPYSLQWNVALEQSLSDRQAMSASYLGAVGRRLIQEQAAFAPAGSLRLATVLGGHATSDYHALQLQFRRQVSRGLQALAFYSWSHSIDESSSSTGQLQNAGGAFNRGPSDFDVRHSFSAGVTYQVPNPAANAVLKRITGGWSVDSIIQGRSATPVGVTVGSLNFLGSSFTAITPDLVPGQPVYLFGPQFPGGKAINNIPGAAGLCSNGLPSVGPFCNPPTDPVTHLPLRDGNLGRNGLRGFGAFQWDLAASRTFVLRETLRLQLRAEFFNVLNHPNFANPVATLGFPSFGRSTQTLNYGLNGGPFASGGFSPLFQIGGPRSGQLALKLLF